MARNLGVSMNISRFRYFIFSFFLMQTIVCFAEGPLMRHKEPEKQLEFENVYQFIRAIPKISSSTLPPGASNYIQNSTTLQTGSNAYPATLKVGVSGSNPIFEVSGTSVTAYQPVSFNSTMRMGVAGTYMLCAPTNGCRFNDSADLINIIIASNSGEVTQPNQPSFLATANGSDQTDVSGDATAVTVNFGTEIFDQGADFASNTFTAPITGRYLLCAHVKLNGLLVAHTVIRTNLVTSNRTYSDIYDEGTLSFNGLPMQVTQVADMDAGDTALVQVNVSNGTKVVDITGIVTQTFFSGSLIN